MKLFSKMLTRKPEPEEALEKIDLEMDVEPLRRRTEPVADDSGEIREGLPPEFIRNVIIGGIEYICFTSVAFNRDLSADEMTDNLCRMIFKGIAKDPGRV